MHVAVAAIGVDRPGIAAAVTKVLYEHRCNIEDSRMAILGGQFAMMLIVVLPPGGRPESLEEALAEPAGKLNLIVSVTPVAEPGPGQAEGIPYVVSVYGADRPGIVYRVCSALAERSINITDLATHVIEGPTPVYVMIIEAILPAGSDATAVESDLHVLAKVLEVDLTVRPVEQETL